MSQATAPKQHQKTAASEEDNANGLGRLSDFGVKEDWQVALLLPRTFEDMRNPQSDALGFEIGRQVCLKGMVANQPQTHFKPESAPRTRVVLSLDDGTSVNVTWFGDVRKMLESIVQGSTLTVAGELGVFDDQWNLNRPVLTEKRWLGRCRPVYPGKPRCIQPEVVRERVMQRLRDAIAPAADHLLAMLAPLATEQEILTAIQAQAPSIEKLLVRAHCPHDPQAGENAIASLDKVAALAMLAVAQGNVAAPVERQALRLDPASRAGAIKFSLTDEQHKAMVTLARLFSADRVASALLTGDVGTGKTAVYLLIAAAAADAGARTAILLPNGPLAEQVHKQITETWPDISTALVVKGTRLTEQASITVGTTALLHRSVGPIDLMICDEQHKLGTQARNALCDPTTHILDVTATAIPRTMALVRFKAMAHVHLREGHATKRIRTTLWQPKQARTLYEGVRQTVASGGRTLIVYPAINSKNVESTGETSTKGLQTSLNAATEKWKQQFPGQVRVLMGRMSTEEKNAALADLSSGVALIAICTSVVEVGLNVPDMRRVVVLHPERFGLTQIHQMRGRLAREGGEGNCDLMCLNALEDTTLQRLRTLTRTNDGMKLAEEDMRLRGVGDIAGAGVRQSGGLESPLRGRSLSGQVLESVASVFTQWRDRALNRSTTR